MKNIFEAFTESCAQHRNRTALQMRTKGQSIRYTYSELLKAVEKVKALLIKRGIKPGDRIAIISENRPEWIVAFLAIQAVKATSVPLDIAHSPADLLHLIQFSDLKAALLSQAAAVKFGSSLPADLMALDIQNSFDYIQGSPKSVQSYHSGDENSTIATIVFTSGTTGQPKGVMLSHEAVIHSARGSQQSAELNKNDRILAIIPLHHMYGMGTVMLGALISGSSLTFLETIQRDSIITALKEDKITVLPAVPRLFESLHTGILQQIQSRGNFSKGIFRFFEWIAKKSKPLFGNTFSRCVFKKIHRGLGGHIRVLVCGGAPLSIETSKAFAGWGFTLLDGYGMTEAAPIIASNTLKHNELGTVGRAQQDSEIRIDRANISGEGEVCFRGPSLMKGYFRNPAATKQVLIDGWLHTGDLGKLNERGFLSITGRIKEMIMTSGGKKASPEEIECKYRMIPGVKELAIVGVRSPNTFGEDIAALVVPQNPDEQEAIIQAIHDRSAEVPTYLRIQQIHFAQEIPKTSTMKFRRGQIKSMIESGNNSKLEGSIQTEDSDLTTARVIALIREEFPLAPPALNSQTSLQYDLGIDSLGRMDLAASLQKEFNIHADPEKMFAALTVADLVSLINVQAPHVLIQPAKEFTPAKISSWRTPLLAVMKGGSKLFWRLEGKGLENIPEDSNCIFVPNHQTHFDVFWVMSCLPKKARERLKAFAKRELFENRATRLLAEAAGSIPVDRIGNIQSALDQGLYELMQGYSLLIHPEGTRTKNGQLGNFQAGAAYLAIKAQVPVIPVYIDGGTDIFPPQRSLPRFFDWNELKRLPLKITFGGAILPPKDQTRENENELTQKMRNAVIRLSN